jgi:uncharacterized OsmC-like protein
MNAVVMNQAIVNGIELDALGSTVQAIRNDPELGKAHFRVSNKWLDGNQNRSTVTDFYGAKQDNLHKQQYDLLADEPPILAGNDDAPNPVEHMLHALASCVTTSLVAHAAVRGIRLDEVESEIEGDLDLRGYLGLDSEVPKGYTDIRVNFKVRADGISAERLKRLSMYSPVFNTITQGANVDITVEKR